MSKFPSENESRKTGSILPICQYDSKCNSKTSVLKLHVYNGHGKYFNGCQIQKSNLPNTFTTKSAVFSKVDVSSSFLNALISADVFFVSFYKQKQKQVSV